MSNLAVFLSIGQYCSSGKTHLVLLLSWVLSWTGVPGVEKLLIDICVALVLMSQNKLKSSFSTANSFLFCPITLPSLTPTHLFLNLQARLIAYFALYPILRRSRICCRVAGHGNLRKKTAETLYFEHLHNYEQHLAFLIPTSRKHERHFLFCLATLPSEFQLTQVGRLYGQLPLSPVWFRVRLNYPSLNYSLHRFLDSWA